MQSDPVIRVIIPVLNEEESIGRVIDEIPENCRHVIVADNGSSDQSAAVAEAHGAVVVHEAERGYGAACLRAMTLLPADCDIVVFIDGDYSDYPGEMPALIEAVLNAGYDMVIGSRTLGRREKGALLPQARFGNWLATRLIKLFWGFNYTDLGPFRAIRYEALNRLNMRDRNFGWTVEMQIKALQHKLRITEIPVSYRPRIGQSKVTGTLKGTVMAGYIILKVIFKSAFGRKKRQ